MLLNCSRLIRLINVSTLSKSSLLHTSSIRNQFKYARTENGYFKEIYSEDLQFQRLEHIIKNKRIVEDEEMLSFDNLVKTTEITNQKLIPFFKNFTENLKNKDVDSLIFVLNRLRESKFKHLNASMHYLISFLDQNLASYLNNEEKITNERFEILFQTALLFDEIGLQSWSKFIRLLSVRTLENIQLIENKENLLRLLYIWNLSRRQIEPDKALLVELQVIKFFHLKQFNLRECGIICLGFHKTQTKFQTNLIEQITEKLVNEISTLDDTICLCGILKGIYSSNYQLDRGLLNKLKDKIFDSKYGEDFLVMTKLFAIEKKYRYYDEKLIDKTIQVFSKQETIRIKELSRLLLNLLFFDVQLNSKQIGKFNELFEHFKSNFVVYRIEYLLSVYALASHGLIRKEEIYNIFDAEFIKILQTKYQDIAYYFINLNNILKLYGGANYRDIALKDKEILKYFKCINTLSKQDVYAKFKKFEHYPSKLYLTYQVLFDNLGERVHLIHIMPGVKYPFIVITPKPDKLKDYPYEVTINSAKGSCIVQVPSTEVYCDKEMKRINGYYKLENDLLKKMGFQLFGLENHRISHNSSELKKYVQEEVIDKLNEE